VAVGAKRRRMTTDQSKNLKVGARVCFNSNQADSGTVTATHARYLTIKWDDGHQSYTGHNDMKRVELLAAKR
jgi:hypothetical protein